MLLTAGSFQEFASVLQLTLYVGLSWMALLGIISVFIHYRRKRRSASAIEGDGIARLIAATPEELTYDVGDDYVYYDQRGVIKEYKKKLLYSHARYTALRHDYDKMLEKAPTPADSPSPSLHATKIINMEDQHVQVPETHDVNETLPLHHQLNELNQSYQRLEEENSSSLKQIGMLSATEGEKAGIIQQWNEENSHLRDKIAELEYLKDVLEEKKVQVDFLQGQLEKHIQRFHQSERQAAVLKTELEKEKKAMVETSDSIRTLSQELAEKSAINGRLEQALHEKQELVTEKSNTITWLENTLQELRQQNEMLTALAADQREQATVLQARLETEIFKTGNLEERLERNRLVLRKAWKELSACVDDAGDMSEEAEIKPALTVIR